MKDLNLGERLIALLLILLTFIPFSVFCLLNLLIMGRPVFFLQKRIGKTEKPFTIIKLRTIALNTPESISTWGKFLRKFKVDEVPQIFNVLSGDMSFVGPRPLLPEYLSKYSTRERRRHTVRPGITGLVQISGGNQLSWKERFELDLIYVEKKSLWLDVKIILKTFLHFISGKFLKDEAIQSQKYEG